MPTVEREYNFMLLTIPYTWSCHNCEKTRHQDPSSPETKAQILLPQTNPEVLAQLETIYASKQPEKGQDSHFSCQTDLLSYHSGRVIQMHFKPLT